MYRKYAVPAGALIVPNDRARLPYLSFKWAPAGAVTSEVSREYAAKGLRDLRARGEVSRIPV